jgi:hypothetical protein
LSYRARLRREGLALALVGLAAAAALLLGVPESRERPPNTVLQLLAVAGFLVVLGPRAVRGWAGQAEEAPDGVTGDPTPLWMLPLVVAAIAAPFALLGAWDAVLRVAGGSALVGLAQAFVLERAAAQEERRLGAELVRLPGSSLLRGTRLGLRPPRPGR